MAAVCLECVFHLLWLQARGPVFPRGIRGVPELLVEIFLFFILPHLSLKVSEMEGVKNGLIFESCCMKLGNL